MVLVVGVVGVVEVVGVVGVVEVLGVVGVLGVVWLVGVFGVVGVVGVVWVVSDNPGYTHDSLQMGLYPNMQICFLVEFKMLPIIISNCTSIKGRRLYCLYCI